MITYVLYWLPWPFLSPWWIYFLFPVVCPIFVAYRLLKAKAVDRRCVLIVSINLLVFALPVQVLGHVFSSVFGCILAIGLPMLSFKAMFMRKHELLPRWYAAFLLAPYALLPFTVYIPESTVFHG